MVIFLGDEQVETFIENVGKIKFITSCKIKNMYLQVKMIFQIK